MRLTGTLILSTSILCSVFHIAFSQSHAMRFAPQKVQPSAISPFGPRDGRQKLPLTDKVVAFIDVNVVPMDSERLLKGQTVLIRNGKIAEIGLKSKVKVPKGAERINGRGKYLLPGLADMHVHIWTKDELPLYLANGVTVVRNMDGRPFHLEWREQIASGDLLGPSLYTSGPSINNNRANLLVKTAAEARQVVRAQKEAGYDFIKVYTFIPKDAYDAIIETAKELRIPVVGHQPERLGLLYTLKSGQISQEHLLGYYGFIEDPTRVIANLRRGEWSFRYIYGAINIDKSKIAVAAAATREAGVWNCPTLVAMDRWIPADEAKLLLAQPQMRFVSPQARAKWNTERFMTDSSPEIRKQGREVRRLLVKGLREAGARLLCGTDAGTDNVEPGFSIHAELQALTEAGLTPYEAIRAATFDAAEFLKAEDQFGTVALGKRADLILLEANPLDSVANVRRNVGVMVRGKWFTRAQLQRMLEDVAAGFEK